MSRPSSGVFTQTLYSQQDDERSQISSRVSPKSSPTMGSNRHGFWNTSDKEQGTEDLGSLEQELQTMMWKRQSDDVQNRLRIASSLAEKNDARGYYILAMHFRHGWGVKPDQRRALSYYRLAAEQRHAGACYELARIYAQGNQQMNVAKDYTTAHYYADKGIAGENITSFNHDNYNQNNFVEQLKGLKKVLEVFNNSLRM
jgi:TPR repeat protein